MRRALLFDFDGLIVDTESAWARVLVDLLAEDGVSISMADVRPLIGVAGADFDREWDGFARRHLGDGFDRESLRDRAVPRLDAAHKDLDVLPGVGALLDGAREQGWRVGLGTGTQRATLMPRLEARGLVDAFDEIVTIDDVERGKPAPDIYLELARRLEVEPEGCVVLEDSVYGCAAALAANMAVVVCPCEATTGCEFPDGAVQTGSLADIDLEVLDELIRASVRPRR